MCVCACTCVRVGECVCTRVSDYMYTVISRQAGPSEPHRRRRNSVIETASYGGDVHLLVELGGWRAMRPALLSVSARPRHGHDPVPWRGEAVAISIAMLNGVKWHIGYYYVFGTRLRRYSRDLQRRRAHGAFCPLARRPIYYVECDHSVANGAARPARFRRGKPAKLPLDGENLPSTDVPRAERVPSALVTI